MVSHYYCGDNDKQGFGAAARSIGMEAYVLSSHVDAMACPTRLLGTARNDKFMRS